MRELLRMSTAGSVDDGKSTLIGRLLLDTGSLPTDHLAAVAGAGGYDLAALSDGLRAEREQGITIDVAYRYFSTPTRSYVLADTPGHERYTRNMVTGTSTAHLSVVLVDARAGVVDQTRRHARIARLLGVPHLVAAVNKMDLVGFDEGRFRQVEADLAAVSARLGVSMLVVPVAARDGDNVVHRSERTPWYRGVTLLEHLEGVDVAPPQGEALRLPVQWVTRPRSPHQRRRYAGRMAGGVLRVGDPVVVLPSGSRTRVVALDTLDEERSTAVPPLSVTVELADDLDVGRGDVLVGGPEHALPVVARTLRVELCWMHEAPLAVGRRLLVKVAARTVPARVTRLHDRVDPATLATSTSPERLEVNDLGAVTVVTDVDVVVEPYQRSRELGAVLLVDPHSHATLAAGVVRDASPDAGPETSPGLVVWARPGPGGAQVPARLPRELSGRQVYRLGQELLASGLLADLTAADGSVTDRAEALRRTAHAACLLADAGLVVVAECGAQEEPTAVALVRDAGYVVQGSPSP